MATFKYIMTEPNYTPERIDDILPWHVRIDYISPTAPTSIQVANIFGTTEAEVYDKVDKFIAIYLQESAL